MPVNPMQLKTYNASLSKPNRPEILPLLSSHCPSLGICGIVVSEKVQSAVYGES